MKKTSSKIPCYSPFNALTLSGSAQLAWSTLSIGPVILLQKSGCNPADNQHRWFTKFLYFTGLLYGGQSISGSLELQLQIRPFGVQVGMQVPWSANEQNEHICIQLTLSPTAEKRRPYIGIGFTIYFRAPCTAKLLLPANVINLVQIVYANFNM